LRLPIYISLRASQRGTIVAAERPTREIAGLKASVRDQIGRGACRGGSGDGGSRSTGRRRSTGQRRIDIARRVHVDVVCVDNFPVVGTWIMSNGLPSPYDSGRIDEVVLYRGGAIDPVLLKQIDVCRGLWRRQDHRVVRYAYVVEGLAELRRAPSLS